MKLNDFDKKKVAVKALKENYKVAFDPSNLNKTATLSMLRKVRSLAMEAKQETDFYKKQSSSSYMKLVFMEQALVTHYNDLLKKPSARIVFENEEVEKSQVVLAAQDLVDSVQKMLEEVSDMKVKELPALVESIQSEIGVNEADQFNSQVDDSLGALLDSLTQSKTALQGALGVITGQGGEGFGADMGAGGEEEVELGGEETTELPAGPEEMEELPELPTEPEEPEASPLGGAGRPKR